MKCFTQEEIVAIYKVANQMVLADGKVLQNEVLTVNEAMKKIGVYDLVSIENIKKEAEKMALDECYGNIAFLNLDQKTFVSAMLGAICSSDGDIDDNELELWRALCNNCDLPKMNNRQAICIFNSHKTI